MKIDEIKVLKNGKTIEILISKTESCIHVELNSPKLTKVYEDDTFEELAENGDDF